MPDVSQLTLIAKSLCAAQQWEFIEKVGEGSYKESFRIRTSVGDFALKLYKPGSVDARAVREIKVMEKCDHAGIVKLLQVSEFLVGSEKYSYIIEEYLPGRTLTTYLEDHGPLNRAETLAFGASLIDALEHIALNKVVHRDIKPDNILLRTDITQPVIIDFGIARDLTDASLTADWLPMGPGSPYFAAPEQLNNRKQLINWRTDQFALGVVLSLCAFLLHPYDGGSPIATVENVRQLQNLAGPFLANVEALNLPVLKKMVAPWPVQRYTTPTQLSDAWLKQGE